MMMFDENKLKKATDWTVVYCNVACCIIGSTDTQDVFAPLEGEVFTFGERLKNEIKLLVTERVTCGINLTDTERFVILGSFLGYSKSVEKKPEDFCRKCRMTGICDIVVNNISCPVFVVQGTRNLGNTFSYKQMALTGARNPGYPNFTETDDDYYPDDWYNYDDNYDEDEDIYSLGSETDF